MIKARKPVLSLHLPQAVDPRLNCQVLVVSGHTTPARRELKSLGFHFRRISGGEGVRASGCWVTPASRFSCNPELRAKLAYLLAKFNGCRSDKLLKLRDAALGATP